MAVSNSSTEACVVFEKACTKCGVMKPLDGFFRKSGASDGRSSACKACAKSHTDNYRSTQEWRKRNQIYVRQKSDERQRLTGHRGDSPESKRMYRWMKKGYSRQEALKLSQINGHEANRLLSSEKKNDFLAQQNARQAWDYWVNHKAPKKWLKAYWKSAPWKQPGLTEAERFRLRYRHDPEYCLRQKMRAHMRRRIRHDRIGDIMRLALKRNGNSNKVEHLLGYSIAELKKHLEGQFTYRMSWEKFNKGLIHIDHILPISSFDFRIIGDSEWKACWALTNLRPLWAKDNIAKSNKLLFLL